ncbi:hypothetical protein Mapa_000749 [Marchantia paleacea]|nr:hypothetical protein Mapa_000749 [Marchantia paleacea]
MSKLRRRKKFAVWHKLPISYCTMLLHSMYPVQSGLFLCRHTGTTSVTKCMYPSVISEPPPRLSCTRVLRVMTRASTSTCRVLTELLSS